jgi:hypothetical protein
MYQGIHSKLRPSCRYMPGVKKWIDNQILEAWVKGLQDRCHVHVALQGKQDEILSALRKECATLTERHAHRRTDSRSETHIQVASLVLATHKVLLPYVRNEGEVIDMLREQNGSKSEAGIRCASHLQPLTLPWLPRLLTITVAAWHASKGRVRPVLLQACPHMRTALCASPRQGGTCRAECLTSEKWRQDALSTDPRAMRVPSAACAWYACRWLSKFGFLCKQVVLRQTPLEQVVCFCGVHAG